jgi:hypothetical protein
VKWTKVTSTNVTEISDYDPETRSFEVRFKGGGQYRHEDVPKVVYDDFLASESKGVYYNAHLKNRFGFRRVPSVTDEDD